jgi:hypothetical protein
MRQLTASGAQTVGFAGVMTMHPGAGEDATRALREAGWFDGVEQELRSGPAREDAAAILRCLTLVLGVGRGALLQLLSLLSAPPLTPCGRSQRTRPSCASTPARTCVWRYSARCGATRATAWWRNMPCTPSPHSATDAVCARVCLSQRTRISRGLGQRPTPRPWRTLAVCATCWSRLASTRRARRPWRLHAQRC